LTTLPMFPLGVVHFPHVHLPLRVFEPRYRLLTRDCLAANGEFGVVLIERGSEVGGGDVRYGVGTATTIIDAGIDGDGVIRLDTVGTRRIRVSTWLTDDPYPRADVVDAPLRPLESAEQELLRDTDRLVRRALALRAELNEPAAAFTTVLADDQERALFQLAAIAPLGPADHQRVLSADDPAELLALLSAMVAEEAAVLAQRLAGN
jgi:Lon protease-like protein